MESKKIIEKNRLIAQFMGLLEGTHPNLPPYWVIPTEENCQGEDVMSHEFIEEKNLKYDSSWSWLMPVLIKIGTLESGRFLYELNHDRIEIWDWASREKGFLYYSCFEGEPRNYDIFGGVYKAVVEFVKWHNKQNN